MTRKATIREMVKRVLSEQKITRPPVPIDEIVRAQGVGLLEINLPDDDISGILYLEEQEEPKIFINASHALTRKRFSIAHELGHYLLHNQSGIHIDKKSFFRNKLSQAALDPVEIEANRFAAEMLMPGVFIEQCLTGYDNLNQMGDEEIIIKLAGDFEVSTHAMSFRLQNLGYLTSI